MQSYDTLTNWAAVAVDAATPVVAFSTATMGRKGIKIKNSLGVVVCVSEIKASGSAPSFADMVTSRINDGELQPGEVYESGARDSVKVYVVAASGSGNVYAREVL